MRVVSVAASLAVLVLLALIVRRAGGSTVAGIVAAGLYAATYRVSGAFADTARVDSLLLALLLAAVFVGMRARTWRGGIGLGAMLLLAFLTKQNALLVAAPMLLWLLVRRRSVGVGASATLGVGVVASTLVGNLLTDGWYARYVVEQLPTQSWSCAGSGRSGTRTCSCRSPCPRSWWWWRSWSDGSARGRSEVAGMHGPRTTPTSPSVRWGCSPPRGSPASTRAATRTSRCRRRRRSPERWACCWPRWLRSGSVTATVAWVVAGLLAVQVVTMSLAHIDVVPSQQDRDAGDRFIATLRQLPGSVLVPTHPYYLRLAGLPTHASAIAIYDLSHAKDGPEYLSGCCRGASTGCPRWCWTTPYRQGRHHARNADR